MPSYPSSSVEDNSKPLFSASGFLSRPSLRDQIEVWTLSLQDVLPDYVALWYGVLNAEERARADRFIFQANRTEYIAAHALVRLILSQFYGMSAEHLQFKPDVGGKPFVLIQGQPASVSFSLSHTSGCVGFASIANNRTQVGFDLEARDRQISPQTLDLFLSHSEAEGLSRYSENERDNALIKIWTLKEAYIKAIGTGLSEKLDQFSFQLNPPKISFSDDRSVENWQFSQRELPSGHIAALGWDNSDIQIEAWHNLSPKDIRPLNR